MTFIDAYTWLPSPVYKFAIREGEELALKLNTLQMIDILFSTAILIIWGSTMETWTWSSTCAWMWSYSGQHSASSLFMSHSQHAGQPGVSLCKVCSLRSHFCVLWELDIGPGKVSGYFLKVLGCLWAGFIDLPAYILKAPPLVFFINNFVGLFVRTALRTLRFPSEIYF